MAEFASISSLLHEKCEENIELQKYCLQIAAKYLDFAKKELRAQNIREENIMLKLDIGNLESIYRTVTETNETQAELDSLLLEYYDEHLRFAFDVDECELEKLASYDEIKLELETRDSINMYQRLYERKVKMAKKMDERNIVKQYRQAEQDYSMAKTQRLNLEERINKANEFKARRLEERHLILQLVQGSVELQNIFAEMYPQKSQSQLMISGSQRLSGFTLPDLNKQKVGLSSRLLVNFKQFKIPAIPALPRIRKINQINGLNRLLQQSEVIRKSMQASPITLSCEFATPKLPGILKAPGNHSLSAENSQKTVSFDVNLQNDVEESIAAQDIPYSEFENDSEMEEILHDKGSNANKIEITEDVLIKAADKIHKDSGEPLKAAIKRKTKREEDTEHDGQSPSPPKMKYSPSEISINMGSKSFMEMFMDLSKDTSSQMISLDFEPVINRKQAAKAPGLVGKEMQPMEKKKKETIDTKPKLKTKGWKKQFDGFDEFLSQFAGDTTDAKDNEKDQLGGAADMTFDFFQADEENDDNDEGGGCDNLSFEF